MKTLIRLAACAALLATTGAGAVVVDFESEDFETVLDNGASRTVQGFDFTLQSGNGDAFYVSGLYAPGEYVESGSRNLFAANYASLGIASNAGLTFGLNSFQLGGGLVDDPDSWASAVVVVGRVAGGGTLVESFALPTGPTMRTVTLSWSNLASVELFPLAHAGSVLNDRDYTIDNFDVSPVPEPSTWGLMVAGLGVAGWAARRQRPLGR